MMIKIELTRKNFCMEISNLEIDCIAKTSILDVVHNFILNENGQFRIPISASDYDIKTINDICGGEITIDNKEYKMLVWVPFDKQKHRQHWRLEQKIYDEFGTWKTTDEFENKKESNEYEK